LKKPLPLEVHSLLYDMHNNKGLTLVVSCFLCSRLTVCYQTSVVFHPPNIRSAECSSKTNSHFSIPYNKSSNFRFSERWPWRNRSSWNVTSYRLENSDFL